MNILCQISKFYTMTEILKCLIKQTKKIYGFSYVYKKKWMLKEKLILHKSRKAQITFFSINKFSKICLRNNFRKKMHTCPIVI